MAGILPHPGPGVGDNSTLSEANHPVGEAGSELYLMEAADDGDAALDRYLAQERKDEPGRFRIETGDRLVGEDDAAVLGEHTGDGDPLLLTTGETVGPPAGVIEKAHAVERGERVLPVRRPEPTEENPPGRRLRQAADEDVVAGGGATNEIELLEDHPDFVAGAGETAAVQRMQRSSGDEDLAFVGGGEPTDAIEQRRLAGAAGANEGDHLARRYAEGEAIKDHRRRESLGQVDDIDPSRLVHAKRRRSQALSWSIAVTIARMIRMIANSRGKSRRSTLFFSSWPMPPAPTMPSTVDARTLNSQR